MGGNRDRSRGAVWWPGERAGAGAVDSGDKRSWRPRLRWWIGGAVRLLKL